MSGGCLIWIQVLSGLVGIGAGCLLLVFVIIPLLDRWFDRQDRRDG